MHPAVDELAWKVPVTKKFWGMVVRWLMAQEIMYKDSMDQECDPVRDLKENCRSWNTQQVDVVNQAHRA